MPCLVNDGARCCGKGAGLVSEFEEVLLFVADGFVGWSCGAVLPEDGIRMMAVRLTAGCTWFDVPG